MNLESQLAQLEDAQLIRHLVEAEPAFIFKHALTQASAYESLLKQARHVLHRRVAETIEQIYADRLDENAALLAHHFGKAGEEAKRFEYAARAGDVAVSVFAPAEARFNYADAFEALANLPDNQENRRHRLDILVKQVSVSLFAELPTQNIARLNQAEVLAQEFSESDASVQLRLAQIYHAQGFVHLIRNETRETLRLYRQSRALAQAFHDDQLVASTSFDIGVVMNLHGRFDEAEKLIRESILVFEKAHKPHSNVNALAHLGYALAARGFYAEALREAQRGLVLAQELGQPLELAAHHSFLALIYYMGGDPRYMLEASRTTIRFAEKGSNPLYVYVGCMLQAWAEGLLGQDQAALGSVAQAKAIVEMFQGQVPMSEWLVAAEAEIVIYEGNVEGALSLARQAAQSAHALDNLFIEGIAQRVWGQALAKTVGGKINEETDVHFVESLRLFAEGDAKIETARTHFVWGKLLRERGDAASAREHFEQAAAQFEASGLTRELEETRALLA